jgi:hypothetical protein
MSQPAAARQPAPSTRPPLPGAGEPTLRVTPQDAVFHFCTTNVNPELWRTTVPLIVRVRCQRHKGLIATWTAIHWLIVLYAANGHSAFGVREIAEEAGVGRNQLTGPNGFIQRLVGLGLLRIVGGEPLPGVRDRPIYAIDLAELEQASMALVPALLNAEGVPPPPASDAQQRTFRGDREAMPKTGPALSSSAPFRAPAPISWLDTGTGGATLLPPLPARRASPPATGTGDTTATALPALDSGMHQTGTGGSVDALLHQNGTAMHQNGTVAAYLPPSMHQNGTAMHQTGTGDAPNRDVRGEEKEREKERERETQAAPADFASLIQQTVQQAMQELREQTRPATLPPMRAPAGQPPINHSLVALWSADRDQVRQRDLHQLDLLAGQCDLPTDGHGAYWVGRALLLAETCLEGRGQRPTIPYLKAVVRRWQEGSCWGSDLDGVPDCTPRTPSTPTVLPHDAPSLPPAGQQAAQPDDAAPAPDHPALVAYRDAFGTRPNTVQINLITATVRDLTRWEQVLTDWQANGWNTRSVASMLDRYTKGGAADASLPVAPVSVQAIYHHPDLTDPERDRWLKKFHAASTPQEQQAILTRLHQEHPHA